MRPFFAFLWRPAVMDCRGGWDSKPNPTEKKVTLFPKKVDFGRLFYYLKGKIATNLPIFFGRFQKGRL